MTDKAYPSLSAALRGAFRSPEAKAYSKQPFDLRGGIIDDRDPDALSAPERAGQDGATYSILKRRLKNRDFYALFAKYSDVDCGRTTAIHFLLDGVLPSNVHGRYMRDAARTVFGLEKMLSDKRWAERLGVTDRTLRHWKNGSGLRPNMPAIITSLRNQLSAARTRASEILMDADIL